MSLPTAFLEFGEDRPHTLVFLLRVAEGTADEDANHVPGLGHLTPLFADEILFSERGMERVYPVRVTLWRCYPGQSTSP